jgi:hypothetical protein
MGLFSSKKKKKKQDLGQSLEINAINIKDIIAPSSIALSSEYLKLGEKYGKSFFIFSYPRYLTTG